MSNKMQTPATKAKIMAKLRLVLSPFFVLFFSPPSAPDVLKEAQSPPNGGSVKFKTLTKEEAFKRIEELRSAKDRADANFLMCQLLMLLLDNDDKIGRCLDHIQDRQANHEWSNRIVFSIILSIIIAMNAAEIWLIAIHVGA